LVFTEAAGIGGRAVPAAAGLERLSVKVKA
jgi:hypothetical protein